MRVSLGLVLGLALLAQPAGAAPKEEKEDKQARQEAKAERKEQPAATPAPQPQPEPEPEPEPQPQPAKPQRKPRPAKSTRTEKRAPAPVPSPSLTTVPSPDVPPAPTQARVAAHVPVATRTAAPVRPERPARRRADPAPRPRHAVLGFRASGMRRAPRARLAGTIATVMAPSQPRAARAPRRPPAPGGVRRRPAKRAASPPAAAAVTQVVRVIPAPLRLLLAALALLAGLLALRARRLETQRRDLSDDLGLLQSALLPALPDRIGQAWVSAAYRPAEGLAAGGDFYDAFALDEHRTCLLVGDVAGHGRDAVPLTADVRFTLRAYLEAGLGPRAALRATAGVMEPRLAGRFVTVVVAVLDARTGRLTYATAGHPPPLLAGTEERLLTAASCPAIGTGLPTGLRQTTFTLPPGATACFYTDGLADATTPEGGRLGPAGVAEHLAALGPRGDASRLLARIVARTGSQPDDMAACLLRPRLGAVTAREDRVEELELTHPDGDGRARRFLRACGVPEAEAASALAAAHDLLPVVLEVHCGDRGATVAVHRPDVAALPLS